MNHCLPKVSVIVTTYNRKEYLTEAIQAILNQTYQDFELIVVDNYSNYDFSALIESFKSKKIFPFQNQNNGIIAINRNIGIKHSNGDYIAFCDDDDIWVVNKLQDQMNILLETDCDLVYSNMFLFKDDITNVMKITSNKKINKLNDLINNNQINTSSVLVKNKDLFFPEDPNLVAVEDYALWLNLYIKGFRFEFADRPLVYFRIDEVNTSNKYWAIKHMKLIYLHSSILIQHPELNIKKKVFIEILLNSLKFSIKNKFFKNNIL